MTISIDPQKTNNESLQPKGWLKYFSFSLDHKVIGIPVSYTHLTLPTRS